MHIWFLFNWHIVPELLHVRPVSKSKVFGIVVAEILRFGEPSFLSTQINSVKALEDDRSPDMVLWY